MKNNKLQEAYLLSREYALKMRDSNSTNLMLIAQENLIQGMLDWQRENCLISNIPYGMNANKVMKYGTLELKENITKQALKLVF